MAGSQVLYIARSVELSLLEDCLSLEISMEASSQDLFIARCMAFSLIEAYLCFSPHWGSGIQPSLEASFETFPKQGVRYCA